MFGQGFPEKTITKLDDFGFIASRPRGEYHVNNQQMAKLLHKAIGLGGKGKGKQVHNQDPPPPKKNGGKHISNTLREGASNRPPTPMLEKAEAVRTHLSSKDEL
jgi:hypothetical protein